MSKDRQKFADLRSCATILCLVLIWIANGAADISWAAGKAERPVKRIPFIKIDPDDLSQYPNGDQLRERYLQRQGVGARRWADVHQLLGSRQVSRRSQELLRRRGLGPALLGKGAPTVPLLPQATPENPDTLRVLLVRISFESDLSGELTSVTTDGDFQLTADPSIQIDPPPHNRPFYEAHMNGLSEFYHYQSGGRLFIDYEVLPHGRDDSYEVKDLTNFAPGEEGFWSMEGLEGLVREMIAVADDSTLADGSATLADFDDDDPFTYIIFVHAGSDWQSDIGQDSPNDVPTFFVTLGEPALLTSVDSGSGETGSLSECSVIPETTSQDGYVGSIAAALYHEFGHALGLVDLYDTTTGLPMVGIWDLMDSGTNLAVSVGFEIPDTDPVEYEAVSVTGLLPPSLGAWDKWFLGWAEVGYMTNNTGTEYSLPAVQVMRDEYNMFNGHDGNFDTADPQLLIAGSSPDEFFLIENRWVPLGPDQTPFNELFFEADNATGVVMYLGGEFRGADRNSGLYDYFLPAGGLLVWHVNMDRVNANLDENLVNAWGDGVRLLEGDGLQDVGTLDAYVLGFYGSQLDPFSSDYGFSELTTDGFPNSRAFDRSYTGVYLSQVGAAAGVMNFFAGIESVLPGFPFLADSIDADEAAAAGGDPGARAVDPASLTLFTAGSVSSLIFADRPGVDWTGGTYPARLFALTNEGNPRFTGQADLPVGAFRSLTAPLAGPPAVTEFASLGSDVLVLGTLDGHLEALYYHAGSAAIDTLWTAAAGSVLEWAPQIGRDDDGNCQILCAADQSDVRVYDESGNVIGQTLSILGPTGSPVDSFTAAPTRLLNQRWAVFSDLGWTLVDMTADGPVDHYGLHTYAVADSGAVYSAVVEQSTERILLVFDDGGLVDAWTIGTSGDAQPFTWRGDVNEALITEPAVADLDGNGQNDVILATAERLMAFQVDGVAISGFPQRLNEFFPLADSTRIKGPLVVLDADGNGRNDIYFSTDAGHLLGTDYRGKLLPGCPFKWGDSVGQGGMLVGPGRYNQAERVLWMSTEGGYSGPPHDRQRYNGRVMGYILPQAGASNTRSSEWLGAGGGSHRTGAGEATDLGLIAPIAAFRNNVVYYPNPATGSSSVTVRYHSQTDHTAHLAVYNLEGEQISRVDIPSVGGRINEYELDLNGFVSGLYICRLTHETDDGLETTTTTLAVER